MPYKDKEKQRKYQEIWYQKIKRPKLKAKQQELQCCNCKNKIDVQRSFRYCTKCLDYKNNWNLNYRERLKENNICTRCGKNTIDSEHSISTCSDCLEKQRYLGKIKNMNNPNFFSDLLLAKEVLDGRNNH